MHTVQHADEDAPITLVAMSFLGGSAREWGLIEKLLPTKYVWAQVDLPGFGDAAGISGYSVSEMTEHLGAVLDHLRPTRLVLLGHSMSGKVAMSAARLAADGDARFAALESLVLTAASPAGPEPMNDSKRSKMLTGLGGAEAQKRAFAETYVRENLGLELIPGVFENAVEDVLRANPAAWRAWIESGSREDWGERVGVLPFRALVICGEKDAGLGQQAQRRYVLPHLGNARLEEIAGAGHLLPLEAPHEMARLLREFLEEPQHGRTAAIEPGYLQLILSERVSTVTRRVLLYRAALDDPAYAPLALSVGELETLRAIAARVLPQEGVGIDLGARVDKRLSLGTGKGWRFAELPGDLEAYQRGLASLDIVTKARHGACFSQVAEDLKDKVLRSIERREFELGSQNSEGQPGAQQPLTAAEMVRWFEDVRAELAGIYVSHPATLGRMGYSGIADGAKSDAMMPFVELGVGRVESWEPPSVASTGDGQR